MSSVKDQLNTIEAELAYMVSARYAEINGRPPQAPRQDH
jgi:hypothetical protein